MTKVRDMKINNTSIRIMFYNMPCIRNQVALRHISYDAKIFRREGSHLPTQLLAVWFNYPRKCGRPLLTNNMFLARNLCLIIPYVDNTGSLSCWGYRTLNTFHWRDLIATLKHPESSKKTPDANVDWPPHSNSE